MRLTRAADHSGLWLVLAAAGASFAGKRVRGGSRARRASASGFAFAVAASRELPGAGPVLLPLAACDELDFLQLSSTSRGMASVC